ncbi:uncharacterized protein LOC129593945 isoform X2 [Paramacrobiotus metropolitanus]|uniref:uncharacterized protein LOC129593945 isoform X2 n=1 Tax=Paramacrobiotus metropolitanus TaxID=2943436 RepID=UPI0024458CDD|nr:uncharacterized protein LOC129593945 isoform X2 [Paramacrobiotus metropolitanus]
MQVTIAIVCITTLVLLIMHLFHIMEAFCTLPWIKIETVYYIFAVLCSLSSGAVMIPYANERDASRGMCVFFCWTAMIAYIVDALLTKNEYRTFRTEAINQPKYIKPLSEILKLIELGFMLAGSILATFAWNSERWPYSHFYWMNSAYWMIFITIIGSIITLSLLLLEPPLQVEWLVVEEIFCISGAILFCAAGSALIPDSVGDIYHGACMWFCWLAMMTYGVDTFFKSTLLFSRIETLRFPDTLNKSGLTVAAVEPPFYKQYFKTISRIMKILELVFMLIALILAATSWNSDWIQKHSCHSCTSIQTAAWTQFVTITGFIITLTLLFLDLFHLFSPLRQVKLLFIEVIYCGIVSILLITAGAVMIAYTKIDDTGGVCTKS